MRQGAFGGQAAFDQPMRCFGLADACITTAAGVFGAHSDDHLDPDGDNIQPLCAIFADLDRVGAAAGANLVLRLDHLFDALAKWSGRWPRLRMAAGRLVCLRVRGRAMCGVRTLLGISLGSEADTFTRHHPVDLDTVAAKET